MKRNLFSAKKRRIFAKQTSKKGGKLFSPFRYLLIQNPHPPDIQTKKHIWTHISGCTSSLLPLISAQADISGNKLPVHPDYVLSNKILWLRYHTSVKVSWLRYRISVKICGSGIRHQLKFYGPDIGYQLRFCGSDIIYQSRFHGSDIRYQLKFHGSDIEYQLRFCGSKIFKQQDWIKPS